MAWFEYGVLFCGQWSPDPDPAAGMPNGNARVSWKVLGSPEQFPSTGDYGDPWYDHVHKAWRIFEELTVRLGREGWEMYQVDSRSEDRVYSTETRYLKRRHEGDPPS